MKKLRAINKAGGIRTEAVEKATGKSWAEWFAILDKFNVKKHGHKAAAEHLVDKQGCSGWWSQMVVVGYEQGRGLRDKHQKTDGYSVSGSKTLAVSVGDLFKAWQDEKVRRRWLPNAQLTIRKATPGKSLRITWLDDDTNLEVNLYAKGAGKSQVAVEHSKLPDAKTAAKMKAYWGKALEQLKNFLG